MRLPGIGRVSFGARIVVVLVATVLLMQLGTLLIVDVAVNRDVHRQLAARIDVGEGIGGPAPARAAGTHRPNPVSVTTATITSTASTSRTSPATSMSRERTRPEP